MRDLLLGARGYDWDIVVEGDPAPLVKHLAAAWRADITAHPAFGTWVLALTGGRHVDIAAARTETYPFSGSLPKVTFSTIENDLFRRDFTINALALPLRPGGPVIDLHGGLRDLERKTLRVLHPASFRDDPTRIFRLARFAGRGFSVSAATSALVAKDKRYIRRISAERVREELLAILAEPDPYPALAFLRRWGVWGMVLPGIPFSYSLKGLAEVKGISRRLHALLRDLAPRRRAAAMAGLTLSRALKREVELLSAPPRARAALTGLDLIGMGFTPGPLFKKIFEALARRPGISRREAARFVFDNFPRKS